MFQPTELQSTEEGILCNIINKECGTTIYRSLSYPFRSLTNLAQDIGQAHSYGTLVYDSGQTNVISPRHTPSYVRLEG